MIINDGGFTYQIKTAKEIEFPELILNQLLLDS